MHDLRTSGAVVGGDSHGASEETSLMVLFKWVIGIRKRVDFESTSSMCQDHKKTGNFSILLQENKVGNTALCFAAFAAISGIKKIAEVMVNKNKMLSSIRGSKGATALFMAALLGHREMVWSGEVEMRREWSEMEVARSDITGGLWATGRFHGRAAVMGWGRGGLDMHDLRTSGVLGQVKKRV
ncbi:hypothetical protein Pint_12328 [Pistacia integerrima]|uniref:Uncharacterized protein n=1 Tax=Pistacia integerrima TaxID=434235 RepID=A0ACC0XFT2_9ROSI|nr:hypothetical protein Pint_12328 [Pistacia integerrima]